MVMIMPPVSARIAQKIRTYHHLARRIASSEAGIRKDAHGCIVLGRRSGNGVGGSPCRWPRCYAQIMKPSLRAAL